MKEAIICCKNGDIQWENLTVLPIENLVIVDQTDVRAQAQICYDPENLYLHFTAWESEIRAEEEGITGMPCWDSCMEFFFCPQEGDSRYLNFEVNPNGCMHIGYGSSIETALKLVPNRDDREANIFAPEITRFQGGWELTYKIPVSFIRRLYPDFALYSGKTIRANFYKCAEKTSAPHFMTWNVITRRGRSIFHTPAEFGLLRCE